MAQVTRARYGGDDSSERAVFSTLGDGAGGRSWSPEWAGSGVGGSTAEPPQWRPDGWETVWNRHNLGRGRLGGEGVFPARVLHEAGSQQLDAATGGLDAGHGVEAARAGRKQAGSTGHERVDFCGARGMCLGWSSNTLLTSHIT